MTLKQQAQTIAKEWRRFMDGEINDTQFIVTIVADANKTLLQAQEVYKILWEMERQV